MIRPTVNPGGPPLPLPHGGRLVDLLVRSDERDAIVARATRCPSVQLTPRAVCDLELLAAGAFSPLDRFMGRADYLRVVEEMRLSSGLLFPVPITLTVPDMSGLTLGGEVALRTPNSDLVALMTVEETFPWDLRHEARHVCGTTDPRHPLVAEMHSWGRTCISGPLTVLDQPKHHDFLDLRLTPSQLRATLEAAGGGRVLAVPTRELFSPAREASLRRLAEEHSATLLIHPIVGLAPAGDVGHYARLRAYRLLARKYWDPTRTFLGLLPLAPRGAGFRDALWEAVIERNHGATHLAVGRHYADRGVDAPGDLQFPPSEFHEVLHRLAEEIGVTALALDRIIPSSRPRRPAVPAGRQPKTAVPPGGATGPSRAGCRPTEVGVQEWRARPDVARILAAAHPPRSRQGFCLWFTGLSGAGKSTIAEAVMAALLERGRQVTLLDGDVVRTHLSRGLGFSREDRDANIRRIGFVASEVVRHHGAVICAAVSPYEAARNECRAMVGDDRFILIYVGTPIEVCEARDPKGMYAKARRGEIRGFTGVDDPYEPPASPDLVLDTVTCSPADNAQAVLTHLVKLGFLPEGGDVIPIVD